MRSDPKRTREPHVYKSPADKIVEAYNPEIESDAEPTSLSSYVRKAERRRIGEQNQEGDN
jgi:hypothetical protein